MIVLAFALIIIGTLLIILGCRTLWRTRRGAHR